VAARHYDVIVIGRSIGALTAAALLARREFRVLVVGQGERPATYRYDRFVLCRRPFTLLAASSPTWKRVLHELAQSPRFRRRLQALDPMFCFVAGDRRVEVPPDMELYAREVEREFPEVRQLVDELYAGIADVNGRADMVFEKDLTWPPGTVWERLETRRAASLLPLLNSGATHDLFAKFPAGHGYRTLTALPALFATDLALGATELPAFALARLHGAWTRGVMTLERGEDELVEFLVERIEAHGGECQLERRATSIVVERGRAVGIIEDNEEELTSATDLVAALSGEQIAELTSGAGITKQARNDWPRLTARAGRFVVNLVVNTRGLPDPLGRESFVMPRLGTTNPRQPVLHLQRLDAPPESGTERETLLVAEALLPRRGPLTLLEARDAVFSTLVTHLPFLERHLLLVDSPHDGLPLHDYTRGAKREIDRIHVTEAGPGAEPMPWLWSVDPPGYLELGGEPVRGPVPGTYLVGRTVMPALGQEGELLAAWSAARIITRSDRRRQKMRRQMWSKIETG
jgi:phytoene dehydrogenase-like protein